jgi:hypothetical protein
VLWITIFLFNPLQIESHWSEPAGYIRHEPVEWHIAKGKNILSFLELKNYFTRICVKDRKKKEGKRGEEGGTKEDI